MDTFFDLFGKVKEAFSCGRKRKRLSDEEIEHGMMFRIKRRKLSEPRSGLNLRAKGFSESNSRLDNSFSFRTDFDNSSSYFYYDDRLVRKSKQTELFQINLTDSRLPNLKNIRKKWSDNNFEVKKKLNFNCNKNVKNEKESTIDWVDEYEDLVYSISKREEGYPDFPIIEYPIYKKVLK